IEQEVLHVNRDELARVAQLVGVGAARHLAVAVLAGAAAPDPLRPAGQVEQARVVAEAEAAPGLPAAEVALADRAGTGEAGVAAPLLQALGRGPQAGAV